MAAIDEHREWLLASGELEVRRVRRARDEVEALAVAMLRRRLAAGEGSQRLASAAEEVAAGRLDPHTAAAGLVDEA